ncbi:hypothetical protein RJT34_16250 [Clitoria ternatea]|uniref:Sphingomyelin synthase-like domain-containing protein n=1 Tax=Clitoria ternatea TaxID=43366 RepID=A0AAN9J6V4_CLITE
MNAVGNQEQIQGFDAKGNKGEEYEINKEPFREDKVEVENMKKNKKSGPSIAWGKHTRVILDVGCGSLLIVASPKHYTIDAVVAWYTVNLVVFFIDKKLVELPDRSITTAALLPFSIKDKQSKTKEENHKLLNGNSGDPVD